MSQPLPTSFRCMLCGSEEAPSIIQQAVKGDESGLSKAVRCASCAHVQLSPTSYDLRLYEEDGQTSFVVSHYGTPIETLFDHSAIEARRRVARFADRGEGLHRADGTPLRLLDVGGGYGFFGSALTAARPDVETMILEPSASRAERGRRYFAERCDARFPPPSFAIGLLDDEYVRRHRGSVDIVTLWHVLEHADDPLSLMKRAGEVLRPGGRIWIEVPNLDDELMLLSPAYRERSFMREHLSYFSANQLERMARRLFAGADVQVSGYQRYGIFNYFHWIHFNAPQGAAPDLWQEDRWWLETLWRTRREEARTSDALLLVIRPGGLLS